eukprot:gb/GEZN01001653.1/.p1 GENE.gb/GEZN01001653.1/~~gb/GEZN01001653.1/.p1  ORF type:complete len:888 (+),score=95.88 gb/GEZN01001653.1/:27-2666(+)
MSMDCFLMSVSPAKPVRLTGVIVPSDAKVELGKDNNARILFFKGSTCLTWHFTNDYIIEEANKIGESDLKSLPARFHDGIDAACRDPIAPGHVFFFNDDEYVDWDWKEGSPVSRKKIKDPTGRFSNLPAAFHDTITCACIYPTMPSALFLVKGQSCLKFDCKKNQVVKGPEALSSALPGLPTGWVDADLIMPRPTVADKELMIFRGDYFCLYDCTKGSCQGPWSLSEKWFQALSFTIRPYSERVIYGGKIVAECRPSKPTSEILFFKGNQFILWDFTPGKIIEGPARISNHTWFKAMPYPFNEGFDAIVRRPTAKDTQMLMFKKEQYLVWNFQEDKVVDGPRKLSDPQGWFANLPKAWLRGITSICMDPQQPTKYFIITCENQWLRWDFTPDKIKDGPFTTSEGNFVGLPEEWRYFDSLVLRPTNQDDHLIISRGDEWLLYSWKDAKVLEGPFGYADKLFVDLKFKPITEMVAPSELASSVEEALELKDTSNIGERKHAQVSKPPKEKHVMLSYNWDIQPLVKRVYHALVAKGVPVWLDIMGGMKGNINLAMANAVENAGCIVPFMTQKYQDSRNCRKELNYADARSVPMVPVKSQQDWIQSSWLGAVVAGLLWVDAGQGLMEDPTAFEGMIDHLVREITAVWENVMDKGHGKRVTEWQVEEVKNWLESVGLSELNAIVEQKKIDGNVLLTLTDDDLQNSLGIADALIRRKFSLALKELQQSSIARSTTVAPVPVAISSVATSEAGLWGTSALSTGDAAAFFKWLEKEQLQTKAELCQVSRFHLSSLPLGLRLRVEPALALLRASFAKECKTEVFVWLLTNMPPKDHPHLWFLALPSVSIDSLGDLALLVQNPELSRQVRKEWAVPVGTWARMLKNIES